jgi:L-ascorbate metabolism protein UlaG (beta-lactamase superfamily)
MQITWYGHSAFRLDFGGRAVLIDPFFTGNPAFPPNLRTPPEAGVSHIVLTHGHFDHVGDTLRLVKAIGPTVVTNYDLCMWLAAKWNATKEAGEADISISPMNTGGTTDQSGFSVTLVRADHSASEMENGVSQALGSANGVIVKAPGEPTIWHMGDTDIFSDMALIQEIHAPDVAIVPIGDRFTMSPATAALAVKKFLKVKAVIPCHYGSFPIIEPTADKFVAAMAGHPTKVIVPDKGKPVTV